MVQRISRKRAGRFVRQAFPPGKPILSAAECIVARASGLDAAALGESIARLISESEGLADGCDKAAGALRENVQRLRKLQEDRPN